jgi:hypothetical protein
MNGSKLISWLAFAISDTVSIRSVTISSRWHKIFCRTYVKLFWRNIHEISYRRCESIKQDIGEKYTELYSRQTPITGKLFGMSCLVLTMADSLIGSSTESTWCSYEWLSGCIVNGTSMSGCCTVSGTAIAGYGMGSGTSMPGSCMVNGTSIPGCCIVNGMSMARCCMVDGTSMSGCCMVSCTSMPDCCMVNGTSITTARCRRNVNIQQPGIDVS